MLSPISISTAKRMKIVAISFMHTELYEYDEQYDDHQSDDASI